MNAQDLVNPAPSIHVLYRPLTQLANNILAITINWVPRFVSLLILNILAHVLRKKEVF